MGNEEIAQMTAGGQQAAPVMTQTQGAQSFVMPDMFASPGLTMVGGPQGQYAEAAPAGAASTVVAPTTIAPAAAPTSPKKSSSKKSSKKKVSSKKKAKGCC